MINFTKLSKVTSETILVQFFVGFGIPKTAGIRAYFVCKDNFPVSSLAQLDFKVNKFNTYIYKYLFKAVVYLKSNFCNLIYFISVCNTQSYSLIVIDKWVAQLIIFVAEFKGWSSKRSTLLNAVTL